MYTVPSPDSDPNQGGGSQLPNPNKCNYTLTSGTIVGAQPPPISYIINTVANPDPHRGGGRSTT